MIIFLLFLAFLPLLPHLLLPLPPFLLLLRPLLLDIPFGSLSLHFPGCVGCFLGLLPNWWIYLSCVGMLSRFSHVWLFATPWTHATPVACQAPLTMGFSRQEYWSGLPFPSLLFAIHISFLGWSIFSVFAHLKKLGWLFSYYWVLRVLCIMDTAPLSGKRFTHILSPVCDLSFYSVYSLLQRKRF